MENLLILVILAALVLVGIIYAVRHFKGQGGCCGGGGTELRENKKLDGPKIGEKVVKINGMHCEHCQNRVERMVNRIDGAVCKVNLKKNIAVVSYSKPVTDEEVKAMVEKAGYEVVEISN